MIDPNTFDWEGEARAARTRLTEPMRRDDVLASMTDDQLLRIISRFEGNWVVMNKSGTSVLKDPGTQLPFMTKIKQRAQQVAKDTGGIAMPFADALQQLTRSQNDRP